MKPEIKKIWVEALRSGKYKQGQKYLCRTINGEDRFCCLGVLAHECVDGYWSKKWGPEEMVVWNLVSNDSKCSVDLSEELLIKLGISAFEQDKLVNLNDNLGKDFNQIADWIEENL